ncbi:MAG: phenylalanine--tRNA ligase subunit alpha [Firmicutes bacterium]|nr:phenylalanine--tRNA ligase subunit alpha [Bacillota bacterium]
MWDKLTEIQAKAEEAAASCQDLASLTEIKVAYLGKKGEITQISKMMGKVSPEERPRLGQAVNQAKQKVEAAIQRRMDELKEAALQQSLAEETADVTLPGTVFPAGSLHILTIVRREIEDIFTGMGYTIMEGSQVETDYYNFEALNIPKDHPARDMQDSFYFSGNLLLRTHTSPAQAHAMEQMQGQYPVKIIAPGVVYRRDDDATHSPMFHQVEGLLLDEHVTMGDLKGTLRAFAQQMFGAERQIRLRPSFFPFTEPSAEVDVSCFACGGAGCRLCKGSGWIEILGSGMVHPHVLEMSGYDPQKLTGFAFGMGVERIAMLKYGITDMRLLFDNDVRFLSGFGRA